ncbi:MAG: MFS transporter [Chloroflexota bacterium]|nr:MFS transporter [Chloroflexota bacterium]
MTEAESTGKTTHNRPILSFITYGVCFVSLGLAMASLGPMLPSLADHAGVSLAQISFVFTANNLGYMVGSAGGGRLYDRFKGHRLMGLALVLMVVAGALIPLARTFILLLVLLFVLGLGMGLVDLGGNVNLLWIFQSQVGPYMNALHFSFGVGALIAPILLNKMLAVSGGALTWPFWVLSALFLPGLVGLALLPSHQNPEAESAAEAGYKPDIWLVVLIMALFFIYVGIEGGFSGWIYTYATELGIADETAASYMNSLFWAALTLGRLIAVVLARKVRPYILLIGNFSLALLIFGLILIWPTQPVMIWLGAAGLGLACSSVFPTILALSETRLKITGAVTGLFFLGSSLGGTLVPMLLGQVFDYLGGYEMMLSLTGLTVLGLVVLVAVILASDRVGEKARE